MITLQKGVTSRSRLGVAACVVVTACGVTAAGCSQGDRPALGAVEGVVTLDGAPLPEAILRFDPGEALRGSMGVTDSSGRYELLYIRDIKGAAVGEHRVLITTATETKPEILPPRYHAQTTLTATVQGGKNEINFALTRDPKKP